MFKKILGIESLKAKISELEGEILVLQKELEETETVQDCIVKNIEGELKPPLTIRKLNEALGLIYCNLNFIRYELPKNGEFEDNQNVIYNIWSELDYLGDDSRENETEGKRVYKVDLSTNIVLDEREMKSDWEKQPSGYEGDFDGYCQQIAECLATGEIDDFEFNGTQRIA